MAHTVLDDTYTDTNGGTFCNTDGYPLFGESTGHTIYAFVSNKVDRMTHQMCCKIGDTTIGASRRVEQWTTEKPIYKDAQLVYRRSAQVDTDDNNMPVIFRDYSIHKALLLRGFRRVKDVFPHLDVSSEHFLFGNRTHTQIIQLLDDIIDDINRSYGNPASMYDYLQADNKHAIMSYDRTQSFAPREYQQNVIDKIYNYFTKTMNTDTAKTNMIFLLTAPTRSGKTFTALHGAKRLVTQLDKSITLVVSGKADVMDEWKKSCESHVDFDNFVFLTKRNFDEDTDIVKKLYNDNKHIMVFFTLQDLYGSNKGDGVKAAHRFLTEFPIDVILADEAHFAAFTPGGKINKVFANKELENIYAGNESGVDKKLVSKASKELGKIQPTIGTIFITATPYNVMFSDIWNFTDNNMSIITEGDIQDEHNKWLKENPDNSAWMSPYYGIPDKRYFVFPVGAPVSDFFALDDNGHFMHHDKIYALVSGMFGDGNDVAPRVFTDPVYQQSGLGKGVLFTVRQHSCADELEDMISAVADGYEIINISSKRKNRFSSMSTAALKDYVSNLKGNFIIITCNKALTGTTMEKLDTIVIMRSMRSAQEFVQAAGRVGSPYVVDMLDGDDIIKHCMKSNAAIVCFDPHQMVEVIQDKIAYEANHKNGMSDGDDYMHIMNNYLENNPVYILKDGAVHLHQMDAQDVMSYVRAYSSDKSLGDMFSPGGIVVDIDDTAILYALDTVQTFGTKKSGMLIDLFDNDIDADTPDGLCMVKDCMNCVSPGEMFCDEHKHHEKQHRAQIRKDADNGDKEAQQKIKEYHSMLKEYRDKAQVIVELLYIYAVMNREDDITSTKSALSSMRDNKNSDMVELLGIDVDFVEQMYKSGWFTRSIDFGFQEIEHMFKQKYDRVFDSYKVIFNTVDKISRNEIITEERVADMLLEHGDFSVLPDYGIIDPACKSGVFLVRSYEKYLEHGFTHEELKDKLWCIPTGSISYVIIRDLFEQYGWNMDHIIFDKSVSCLEMNKGLAAYCSGNFVVETEKDSIMKKLLDDVLNGVPSDGKLFDYCVSNPPYQMDLSNTSAEQIYPVFIDSSDVFSTKSIFITPARFLFNQGKTSKKWNNKKLQDPHFVVYGYYPQAKEVFSQADIKGGVVISGNDPENKKPVGTFVANDTLRDILNKVQSLNEGSIDDIIYQQSKFNLDSLYEDFPDYKSIIGSQGREKRLTSNIFQLLGENVFCCHDSGDDYGIIGLNNKGERVKKYIHKKYIEDDNHIHKYKVLVPGSNGSGALGEVISTPMIGTPMIGITQTFIAIGEFDNLEESESLLKYVKSKFLRCMLGTLKITQSNKKNVWKNVPLQDFTYNSDIDWSFSVEDVDRQLYKKYNLNQIEIDFIESNIQAM